MRRVQIGRRIATVDSGEWTSDSATLAGSIQATIDLRGEPSYLPDPDLTLARKAARAFGGTVLDNAEEIPQPLPPDMTL